VSARRASASLAALAAVAAVSACGAAHGDGSDRTVFAVPDVVRAFSGSGQALHDFSIGGHGCDPPSYFPPPDARAPNLSGCILQVERPGFPPLSDWNWLLQSRTRPVPLHYLLPQDESVPAIGWDYQVLVFRNAAEARRGAVTTPASPQAGTLERTLRAGNVLVVYRVGTQRLAGLRAALDGLASTAHQGR
jgi:hypothetical protein